MTAPPIGRIRHPQNVAVRSSLSDTCLLARVEMSSALAMGFVSAFTLCSARSSMPFGCDIRKGPMSRGKRFVAGLRAT